MAPAFTIRFIVRSSLISMAITELNGWPVPFTPSFARASSAPPASPTSNSCPSVLTMQAPKSSGDAAASAGM
jgi:hypothetical protein